MGYIGIKKKKKYSYTPHTYTKYPYDKVWIPIKVVKSIYLPKSNNFLILEKIIYLFVIFI